MGHRTDLYDTVEAKLGEPLADYVNTRRATDPATSWRRIGLEITARTGIDITGEALRVWFVVRGERVA
jgi:hypothetical protein